MKSTGIVRKIDELGRIVIPIEIRRNLGLAERDSVELFTEGDRIILQKYQDTCLFCDSSDKIISFQGKIICSKCVNDLKLF
jgi:transcriptional pleiotropic regulator of transition state genes